MIESLDRIDICARRNDGGLDMLIVPSGPLVGTPEVLDALRAKLRTYIDALGDPGFIEDVGYTPVEDVCIYITTKYDIDPVVRSDVEGLAAAFAKQGLLLDFEAPDTFAPQLPKPGDSERSAGGH